MGNDIYIVDDDEAIRDSLKTLLEAHGFSIHLYSDGERFLEADLMGILGPVLLDVRMPGRNGLDVLEEALIANKTLKIIVMSGHADVAMAVMALKKGALDFIEKPFAANDVLNILKRLNQSSAQKSAAIDADKIARERLLKLTPREREVMEHLVQGKPNKIVASDLGLSVRTVETHRARLLSKLDVKSLSDLVRLSILEKKLA
jgi:two-component system response regulator FixJ